MKPAAQPQQQAARNVQISALNRRSIAVTVFAVMLVIGLIFIPEIISLQSKIFGGSGSVERPEPRAALKMPAAATTVDGRAQTPLEKLSAMIDSGTYSGARKTKAVASDEPLVGKPATWGMLQSKKYNEILVSAKNRALLVASKLGEDDVKSKHAIMNFANGITFVLSGPTKVMSAPEAFSYLEALQLKATRALEEDGVSRNIYSTWRGISLDSARALDNMKEGAQKGGKGAVMGASRFSLILTELKVKPKSTYIKVRGLIRGTVKNIRRVEVYRNGLFLSRALVGRERDGLASFFFRYHDGTGTWAVRIVDKRGDFFERRMQFIRGQQAYAPLGREYPFTKVN